ncbi:hypothetical protein CEP54_003717 [Fusarium duplospermum]|uniref:Uncharacterized protein n=1 Tax=Fusarium duplospermum TaxID=1325734 RepID=A0A428QML2_9HYPO|nr:hypothetical protein CEP54_003717 [Fusarium duplospermum]
MSGLEILGAVASCIAIGQAVKGSLKAVNKLREVRHIRQQCDDLAKEITLIDLLVQSANQHANPRAHPSHPSRPVEECQLVSLTVRELEEIRKELDRIVDKYANPSRPHVGIRMKEKAQWLSAGRKIGELKQKAQKTRSDLGTGINLLVLSMVGGLAVRQEEQTKLFHAFTQHVTSYDQAAQQGLETLSKRLESLRSLPQATRDSSDSHDEHFYLYSRGRPRQRDNRPTPWLTRMRVGYEISASYSADPELPYGKFDSLLKRTWSFVQGEQGGRSLQPTRIHRAVQQGTPIMEALQEQPWAINELDGDGGAPIHEAVTFNNTKALKDLIMLKADINQRDWEGVTPLMLTQIWGHPDMARMLLEHEACRRHINQQDDQGNTALHWAVNSGSPEGVRMLLDAGASVEKRSKVGNTPLHELASSKADDQVASDIVRLLQHSQLDLEARDNYGWTPALQAVRFNKAPVLRTVVNAGGSLSTITNCSEGVLHVAALMLGLERRD